MKLLLRAQDITWTTIGFDDGHGEPVFFRLDTRPETILNTVVKSLADRAIPWDHIESIAAVDGPGSFTALRSAMTIVDAIAFARGIPLAKAHAQPDEGDALVMRRLSKARLRRGWIVPHYGRAPHITRPR